MSIGSRVWKLNVFFVLLSLKKRKVKVMGPILNLLIAPAATYFVSMLINFIRGAAVSDKAMILIVGGISAGVTATEALTGYVSADTTNMIANFLAGLASTFFHQLYTKVKEPAAS